MLPTLGSTTELDNLPLEGLLVLRMIAQFERVTAEDLQLKLGKHAPRTIDMNDMPLGGGASLTSAGDVAFDPSGTSLAAMDAQGAIHELAVGLEETAIAVDVAAWPDGVYFVRLQTAEGVQHTQRFVKR